MTSVSMKRILTALASSVLILNAVCSAASCARSTDEPAESSSVTTSAPDTEPESETSSAYATVEKQDFQREFHIATRTDERCLQEFQAEKMTGELLNDAIFERNTAIQSDFGTKIVLTAPGESAEIDNLVRKQVKGNLDEYDLFIGHLSSVSACAIGNCLYDMNKISSLHMENPWWDQSFRRNITFRDKTYMSIGDVNVFSMGMSACMVFNKRIMKDRNMDPASLYDIVRSGDWTLDKMKELCADVTRDLNGDGKIQSDDDQYCLVSWMMGGPFSFYYGAGGHFVDMEAEDGPALEFDMERAADIYTKIYDVEISSQAHFATDISNYDKNFDIYKEGRALFMDLHLQEISTIIMDGKDPYGILPMPKFDREQKEYLAFINGATPINMIAKNESDTEFVGTILEAMTTYNYDHITPLLFQVITKLQAAQDPDSAQMVDYILRNRIHDFGYLINLDLSNTIREQLVAKKPEIVSRLKAAKIRSDKILKTTLKRFEKCD